MSQYQDIELTCLCGNGFVWTSGEQEFMYDLEKNGKIPSVSEPKRCIPCRKENKERRESQQKVEESRDY